VTNCVRFQYKSRTEDTFKQTNENDSLHEISNANGVSVVNFVELENLILKSIMFPHRNIHKH